MKIANQRANEDFGEAKERSLLEVLRLLTCTMLIEDNALALLKESKTDGELAELRFQFSLVC